MPAGEPEDDLALVLRLEAELQTTACRRDSARLLELLAPDFLEVGASGRVWDLSGVLELLDAPEYADPDDEEIAVTGLGGRIIAEGVILVSWDSTHKNRRARRTSLWHRDPDGWHLMHHQGTILPD